MPLQPGTTLGHYSVTAKIGEGGMGEVWQARDTTLDRDVALKVLPEAFTSDPDRLVRFEREAKVLASLNHPNIGSIYGLEEAEGVKALVLELVEGPTLADRIKQGPIPIDEALPIAKQIAEALEAAHEQGVIHRDLKPANIKVKADGTVKVLDFGLAKAFQPDASDPNMSMSPTISLTAAATQMGMIIGTAAYMAPEQASGKTVDKRADVWAFGVVLYEMLTGTRPFVGDDVSKILAHVIAIDPDWGALPKDVAPVLTTFLRRCLQKDPKKRIRDIGDVSLAMEGAFDIPTGPPSEVPGASVAAQPAWRRALPWVAAAVLTIGTGIAAWTLKPADERPVSRFNLLADGNLRGAASVHAIITLSPDGRRLVYATAAGLYLRSMDDVTNRLILERGNERPFAPFFSPDGESVGYFQGTLTTVGAARLMRVAVTGGAPVALAETSNVFGASWGSNGTILYGQPDGIWRISASGGTPERVIETDAGEQAFAPQRLPGGDWVLFTLARSPGPTRWDDADIVVQSLSSGERQVLRTGGSDARYVPTGHLTYASGDLLFAVSFDLDRLEIRGEPVRVIQGVQRTGVPERVGGVAQYGFADNGTLAYVAGTGSSRRMGTLVLVDRAGNADSFTDEQRRYFRPRMSPDGARVAVEVSEPGSANETTHIWVVAAESGVARQLTFEGTQNQFPVWAPDGQTVIFASDRADGEAWGIYGKAADGGGEATLILQDELPVAPTDVSRDGVLAFQKAGPGGQGDIWTVGMDGEEAASEFLSTPADERAARFSPDGRWVAYHTSEGGSIQVFVRPYPRTEGSQRRISENISRSPIWSPDGRALYFAGLPPVPLRVTSVQITPTFSRGRPEELFALVDKGLLTGPEILVGPLWDITPDGEQFVMVQPATADNNETARDRVNIVLNWFEELKARVPVP